jgi:hypothetical protein
LVETPPVPVIYDAGYDIVTPPYYYQDDNLYVLLYTSGYINTENIQFICLLSYISSVNETIVYKVTDPVTPQLVNYSGTNYLALIYPDIGDVSTTQQTISVVPQAILTLTRDDDTTFFALSGTGVAFAADPVIYNSPTMEPIDYDYNTQTYDLTWIPGQGGFIPGYNVSSYDVYYTVDGGVGTFIGSVDGNVVTYSYEHDFSCGEVIGFYVIANYPLAPSLQSNTETVNVFYVSTPPTDVSIVNADILDGSVDVLFQFSNPTNMGCGDPEPFYWELVQNGSVTNINGTVAYQATPIDPYQVSFTIPNFSGTYYVNVYANTLNTNPPGTAIASEPARNSGQIIYNPILEPISYNYTSDPQNYTLTWSSINYSDTLYITYKIYVVVDGGDATEIAAVVGSILTYSYNYNYNCDDSPIEFYVVASINEIAYVGKTFTSNTETINVFYVSTAPTGSAISSAILLADDSVNVEFTFDDPLDFGCGTPQPFYWELLKNGVAVSGKSGTIDIGTAPYYQSLNIPSFDFTAIYYINIYANTLDTNSPFNSIASPPASTGNIVPVDVPMISNIALPPSGQAISFTVSSATPIDSKAYVFYTISGTSVIQSTLYFKNPETLINGLWVSNYNISIEDTPLFYTISASNEAGIGIETYTPA